MKLITAVEEVLEEDPKTREQEYLWSFFVKVLNKLGYRTYVEFKKGIPSPESIIKERRDVLNKKNKYPKDFKKQTLDPSMSRYSPYYSPAGGKGY